MQRIILIVLLAFLLVGAASCSPTPEGSTSPEVQTVSAYLNALVAKDEAKMTSLICPDWEADALLEMDAFQAVKTSLDGLDCQKTGSDNGAVLVTCQGKILASYTNETQEFDLSQRIYRLEKNGADWQVCGYTTK